MSIITVIRNGAAHLRQCLRSIFDQTYTNIEYICIDGGSTDDTLQILREHNDKVDYFVSEPDTGVYAAMNKGLQLALGDYIIFLNSDDWYEKNAITVLVRAAMASGADVTHADAWEIDKKGRRINIHQGWMHDGIYTKGAPIRHETMLVDKNVYNIYGYYDESYKIIADYRYMITLYDGGCSFEHVPVPVLNFRNTGISYMSDGLRENERARLFKSLFPFLEQEDLALMKKRGTMSTSVRTRLKEKYQAKSEIFAESMSLNINDIENGNEKYRKKIEGSARRYENIRVLLSNWVKGIR